MKSFKIGRVEFATHKLSDHTLFMFATYGGNPFYITYLSMNGTRELRIGHRVFGMQITPKKKEINYERS